MVQGEAKKKKLPGGIQKKSKNSKGAAFTRRHNAPVKTKTGKFNESAKLKAIVSKTMNKNVEEEIRLLSTDGQMNSNKSQDKAPSQSKTKTEKK